MRDHLQANRDPIDANRAPAIRSSQQGDDGQAPQRTKQAVIAVQAHQAQRVRAYMQRVLEQQAERRAQHLETAATDAARASPAH